MNATRRFGIDFMSVALLALLGPASPAIAAEETPTGPPQAAQARQADDGKAWRARGDELLQAGRYLEALDAYRTAESLGAGDELLTMHIAEVYRRLERERDAYWEFNKNRYARDAELRASACYGMNDLQHAMYRSLPKPYFADLGLYGGWQSADDLAYVAGRGRIGATHGETLPTSLYLFGQFSRDNRSGMVDAFPRQFTDNLAIIGVGVEQAVVPALGLKLLAEVGRSYDLANLEPDREQSDVRAGLQMWQEWNTVRFCESTARHPYRFVMTAWAELMYYSRYDDATVFNADLRPGLRVAESDRDAVDVLGVFAISFDSKASDHLQYGEAGVGLRWIPDHRSALRITLRAVETFDSHGWTGPKFGLELDHYFAW